MRINQSDTTEEMQTIYQCIEISRLNEILKSHGIDDVEVRKEICSDYIFENGYFLDAGWFKHNHMKIYPELCFAERPSTSNHGLGEVEILHMPLKGYEYHDFVYRNIDWYFEEKKEELNEVETGSY